MIRPMTSRRSTLVCLVTSLACALAPGFALAQADASENPATMPIADTHFHFMMFMKPEELAARMEKHNIQWVISAGAQGDAATRVSGWTRELDARAAIGPKYFPAVGLSETFVAERQERRKLYDDAENPRRDEVLAQIDRLLGTGRHFISETFPNAETSSTIEMRRRRVATDGPFFQALMKFGEKYSVPVPMHMQWHPESVAGLSRLLTQHPSVTVVLSHCGKDTVASNIREIFDKHPNVLCDLSYRSLPQTAMEGQRDPNRTIYWGSEALRAADIKPDWRQLIEDFPDRFMVGVDDVHSWAEYDSVVAAIRTGLLAKLSTPTAQKVAYKNAQRIFDLK